MFIVMHEEYAHVVIIARCTNRTAATDVAATVHTGITYIVEENWA